MNYLHSYHAGNFCDVVKHVCQIALLEALMRKPSAFCYIDTHAGSGIYDLFSEFSLKTKEYEKGIELVIRANNPPPLIQTYLKCIHDINDRLTKAKHSSLRYYPGSPMIAKEIMRQQDRLVLSELHPNEYQTLKNCFLGMHQVNVHHTDGFLGLKAFLPPSERRGLVLIDPPYEDPDEFARITRSLPLALRRFESGIYAIWYPIKEKYHLDNFYKAVQKNVVNPVYIIELTTYPDLPQHLNGCGMAIINPPWQFNETIEKSLSWLWGALSTHKQGHFKTFSLNAET